MLGSGLLTLPGKYQQPNMYNPEGYQPEPSQQNPAEALKKTSDTTGWPTYTDKESGLSFQYKPGWKVLAPIKKAGFRIIQIDPGKKYYNIKIYISPEQFYIMDGLPATGETIGGAPALNVNNALYGIRANNLYYTFDVGLSMSLLPDFNGLVHSATFGN